MNAYSNYWVIEDYATPVCNFYLKIFKRYLKNTGLLWEFRFHLEKNIAESFWQRFSCLSLLKIYPRKGNKDGEGTRGMTYRNQLRILGLFSLEEETEGWNHYCLQFPHEEMLREGVLISICCPESKTIKVASGEV